MSPLLKASEGLCFFIAFALALRRGSTVDIASPDEIVVLGQERIDEQKFWKEFAYLLTGLEQKIIGLKNCGLKIYAATIAEYRLPAKDTGDLFKQARALDLEKHFCWEFGTLVELVETIDRYMNMGAEELNKQWLGNLRGLSERLYSLVLKMKGDYVK